MRKFIAVIFAMAVIAAPLRAAPGAERGYDPVVRYDIEARLLPEKGIVEAGETLVWKNCSQKAVNTLRFHLYYNAFRNEKSSFLQEEGFYKKSEAELKKIRFGGIDIREMRIAGGQDLMPSMRFICPDDGNREDRTLLELRLGKAVNSGETVTLRISFSLKLPEIISRTGMQDDYFFLSQWFPKIGVLERDGTWNCHQYHGNAEYFADYGSYRVSITLPAQFIVGATGNLIRKKKNPDGTLTLVYAEDMIHDFAWTAWPRFVRIVDSIRLPGSAAPTEIELLMDPRHSGARESYLSSLKFAMRFFSERIMPYPYKKITVVDAPLSGIESWGMEYPTLITAGHIPIVAGIYKVTEMVTVHEYGHQYWYGIVGNDETREAWLDEGVNSFFEIEIMNDYFKGRPYMVDFAPMAKWDWETRRDPLASLVQVDRTSLPSWLFLDHDNYRGNVYSKASLFLKSLMHLTGRERMYRFFRDYARAWAFRHPRTDDFIAAFNTSMKEDYNWAFDQFIRGDAALDNSVYLAESIQAGQDRKTWRNEVVFMRNEGYFPVETLIRLSNGKETRSMWKGKERWKRIISYDDSPLALAAVDPEYKIPLDKNLLNNRVELETSASSFARFYLQLGFLFQTLLSFLTF